MRQQLKQLDNTSEEPARRVTFDNTTHPSLAPTASRSSSLPALMPETTEEITIATNIHQSSRGTGSPRSAHPLTQSSSSSSATTVNPTTTTTTAIEETEVLPVRSGGSAGRRRPSARKTATLTDEGDVTKAAPTEEELAAQQRKQVELEKKAIVDRTKSVGGQGFGSMFDPTKVNLRKTKSTPTTTTNSAATALTDEAAATTTTTTTTTTAALTEAKKLALAKAEKK